jgi:uncharacterized protein (DUF58 family)
MPVPTGRLAVLAGVAAVALLVLPGERWARFVVVNVVLLVVFVADVVACVSPRLVHVVRSHAPSIALGATGELTWRVHVDGPRPARLVVADDLAPSLGATRRRFTAAVPARADVVATTTIRPRRRGRFRFRRVTVRVTGPLGLGSRQRSRELVTELRVLPTFRSRAEAERILARARLVDVGLRTAQGRGGGTEFDQLREYTPDDEIRRMDWAATARSGRPIVRSYRAERNQAVVCLLDNGRVMAGTVAGVPRVEHAMDAVMAVTTVATGLGDRAGLVAFDRRVRAVVPPSSRGNQLGVVVDAMFDLEPELAESDYRGAFLETVARFRRRTLLIVLTELTEAAVDEGLLPALPVIASRHLVVVAGVRDPEVTAWADARVGDADRAYLRAPDWRRWVRR